MVLDDSMVGKNTRILTEIDLGHVLEVTEKTRYPIRNKAIVLLSIEAGLSPNEIASLYRRHVLDEDYLLGEMIDLRHKKSKYLTERCIPFQKKGRLWNSLHSLLENAPATPNDPLIISERACDGGGATKSPGSKELRSMRPSSISYVFYKVLYNAGIVGASALSFRTTFIINESQNRSIFDLAKVSGLKSLDATAKKIPEFCV
jgi:integrase